MRAPVRCKSSLHTLLQRAPAYTASESLPLLIHRQQTYLLLILRVPILYPRPPNVIPLSPWPFRREALEVQNEAASEAAVAAAAASAPGSDAAQLHRMQTASAATEARLREHEQRARAAWEESYAAAQRAEAALLSARVSQSDAELAQGQLAEEEARREEAAAAVARIAHRQAVALEEQQRNPLGLHHPASLAARGVSPDGSSPASVPLGVETKGAATATPPLQPSAPPPAYDPSPPAYRQAEDDPKGVVAADYDPKGVGSAAAADAARGHPGAAERAAAANAALTRAAPPPTYEVAVGSEKARPTTELFASHAPLTTAGFLPAATPDGTPPRCASCFDPIAPGAAGLSGRAAKEGTALYHTECWERSAAPHCAYCARTLLAHDAAGLCGAWGEYRGKRYHVECYQYYAGPRCCLCFDVIFANAERGISGQWRALADGSLIHEECFHQRKTKDG